MRPDQSAVKGRVFAGAKGGFGPDRAYREIRADGRFFAIPEKQNNPEHAARFFKGLDGKPGEPAGLQLTYKWDTVKRRRADLAWLKAAYMVTFATHSIDVVRLDSWLVLPTPGEVRALT